MLLSRRAQRTKQEQFRRRGKTLMKWCDRLRSDCDAEVYLVFRRRNRGKIHRYSSSNDEDWPPSQQTIYESYPLPVIKNPGDFVTGETDADPTQSAGESVDKSQTEDSEPEVTEAQRPPESLSQEQSQPQWLHPHFVDWSMGPSAGLGPSTCGGPLPMPEWSLPNQNRCENFSFNSISNSGPSVQGGYIPWQAEVPGLDADPYPFLNSMMNPNGVPEHNGFRWQALPVNSNVQAQNFYK